MKADAETRERLLTEARRLFAEKGFRRTTVRENAIPIPILISATLSGDIECRVRDRARHPGVKVGGSEPIALLAAQKNRALAEKRCQLNARPQILGAFERVESTHADEVNVAKTR